MTNLNIIPNFEKKTAKFTGTIAAGEKIHVSISNIGGYIVGVENLRLRAVGSDSGTLATFPPFGDESLNWVKDGDTIECDLNLNTVQMLEAVPPASRVMVLFVLDNPEDEILYFKSFFAVDHWPRRVGEDEPVDLGGYSDFVAEAKNSIKEAESAIDAASKNAMNASRNAVEAAKNAEEAVEVAKKIEEGFDTKAEKSALEAVDNRVKELENDDTPDVEVVAPSANGEGKAADAKAVYEALEAKANSAKVESIEEEVLKNKLSADDAFGVINTKLDNKQDSLNEAQMAAVNSGVTAEKVSKLNGVEAGAQKNPDLSEYAKAADVLPRYPFEDAGFKWMNESFAEATITIAPYTNAYKGMGNYPNATYTIEVADGDGVYCRDCVLRLEVPSGISAPNLIWGANFHPRTDAETDFACVAGKRNVYWITEHAPNEFTVAGWQETEGGSAQ